LPEVRWTENALDDLEAILMYIARDSSYYARIFSDKVFKVAENLSQFPNMGRVVPDIGDEEIREILYGSYRIIYRIKKEKDVIEILTIHHGAMLLELNDFLE